MSSTNKANALVPVQDRIPAQSRLRTRSIVAIYILALVVAMAGWLYLLGRLVVQTFGWLLS
jgi:hypothetical protein